MRLLTLFLIFAATSSLPAQSPSPSPSLTDQGWFPFTISAFDDKTPADLDLSHLNHTPAGKHGFIKPNGETLTDNTGKPWRYFGTNLTADACFPSNEEATQFAAHLAKIGINLVRFHFMDENWSGTQLIHQDNQPGLQPEPLARLDFFFAELKKRGIYSNFNLHVGRQYPDQPPGAPDKSKGIDNIYPPYVEALKQYARDLLTHVNPHTGLAYQDDPAIAIVEVNNENTLMMNTWWPAKITGPIHDNIAQQWTDWLHKAHKNDLSLLREKWGVQPATPAPNLVENGTFQHNASGWYLDQQGGAVSTLSPSSEADAIRLTVTKPGSEEWHNQLIRSVPIQSGKTYRLTFRARSDIPKKIYTNTQQSAAPFAMTGLWKELALTPDWQTFELLFTAKDVIPDKTNLIFGPNGHTGWIELSDIHLAEHNDAYLPPTTTFETGIPLPTENANEHVRYDYYQFLAETELNYAKEMHRFLKEDLNIKCLVTHSHIFFGALFGVRREALVSDVVHANAYWHHPNFPKGDWSDKDWEINQETLSQDPTGGILSELAVQRPVGKPFAITEWDIPAPIDTLAEGLPLLAAFANFQGWSGLTLYTFAHSREDLQAQHYHSFFNYQGHPAKRAGIPFAALLFRNGSVDFGHGRTTIQIPTTALILDIVKHNGSIWSNWRRFYERMGLDGSLALKSPTALAFSEIPFTSPDLLRRFITPSPQSYSTTPITWGNNESKVATVINDHVLFATGNLPGKTHTLGPIQLNVAPMPSEPEPNIPPFAIFGLIPLDGQPIATSKKLLGLALSRSENQNMQWRTDRKTVSNQWGYGPSLVLGYEAKVTLPGNESNWTIRPLDPTGTAQAPIAQNTDTWPISPSHKTVWWLLER
ncbi:hypothetical protein FEM03_23600 [Phragmitibacter flavus]|uniref:CBM-cenC domain-containing protein n=1 Tax=Phragmitibacter flavus TaxID=2576071 RepID=A0A5R8K8F7_9BACT|nr:carbohydrate binding domain-containing protein [Phragmitibacter flavus]TLD68245.1 hypothetical protein FEM03_23600 [Phragmitibacter flavus]